MEGGNPGAPANSVPAADVEPDYSTGEAYYAKDQNGELYLIEGADDYKWLEEKELAKYNLEETKPG